MSTKYLPAISHRYRRKVRIFYEYNFATHLSNNGAELDAVEGTVSREFSRHARYTHITIEKLKMSNKKAHPKG